MNVRKRDGRLESVSFDKILHRVRSLCDGLTAVDAARVCKRVVQGVYDGVQTSALDDLAAETAAALASQHPDYALLAGRIAVSNLHKKTSASIRAVSPFFADDVAEFVLEEYEAIDAALAAATPRDMHYDYFAVKTLERSYLLRDMCGAIVERPQTLLMRVALGIHCGQLQDVLETFDLLSRGAFTHATPTMFNAGTPFPHLASCFLLPVAEDSIEGIYETQARCAIISKSAGGIGVSVSNVRAAGSRVASTGGTSGGLVPMLRCFEATARHVDQGGGKRKGAFAAYLEPWHADVEAFLELKKNHGAEELRARDLFYALWIPDLFMRRVEADAKWSLFCPGDCPDLVDLHGAAFDARYEAYERDGSRARKVVRAQDLWMAVLDAQIETGTPFLLYKDACNAKSNQQHLGTIRSSNLCTEIVQYSSAHEIAVCNLASLSLPFFVAGDAFDFALLERVTRIVTRNLNHVIDRNRYARPEAERSNRRHRPIGLGVQGLADVFALLEMPYDSPEARALNKDIFEAIYLAAVKASCELARREGPYETFPGSPVDAGSFQFDLWDVAPRRAAEWDAVRADVAAYGLRNSLLVAPMPTASTAQILGNNECFEPFTSNLYVRRVLAGEFVVINKHLVRALEREGLWSEEVRIAIVAGNGSVQHVPQIPERIRDTFRTAWEMSMRTLLDMSADRGPYVDQSQSLNLFVAQPTHAKLSSMHFYGWHKGLKTGMYYLRTRPASDPVKVTVPVDCAACAA